MPGVIRREFQVLQGQPVLCTVLLNQLAGPISPVKEHCAIVFGPFDV